MHTRNFSSTLSILHKNLKFGRAHQICMHENPLKNNFEHLSRQSLAGHSSFQNIEPLGDTWAQDVSHASHMGAGRTLGLADPTCQLPPVSFLQLLLAVMPIF